MGNFIVGAVFINVLYGWIVVSRIMKRNYLYMENKFQIVGIILVIAFALTLFSIKESIWGFPISYLMVILLFCLIAFTTYILIKAVFIFKEKCINATEIYALVGFLVLVTIYSIIQQVLNGYTSVDSLFSFIDNENPTFKMVSFTLLTIGSVISLMIISYYYLHYLKLPNLNFNKNLGIIWYFIFGLFGFTLALVFLNGLDTTVFTESTRSIFNNLKSYLEIIYTSIAIPVVFSFINKERRG